MKSMTGYARVVETLDEYEITIEIKTLNSKYLNVSLSAPAFLAPCELDMNDIVRDYIKRGKVNIKVYLRFLSPPKGISIDKALAKAYHEALENLTIELGIPEPVKLEDLLRFKDVVRFEPTEDEIDKMCSCVLKVLKKALDKVIISREEEGEKLSKFLEEILDSMRDRLEKIERLSKDLIGYYAENLRENVKKIVPEDIVIDENIIETVIAVLAERADIKEEIDRLKSHISRAKALLRSDEPVGAELDFLAQEMLREFNTILSKSKMVDISDLAIDGKVLVNSFREQVQNVE